VPVNNQSVLLKGINDTVEAQKRLCHGLLRTKVRPYYLFQCDEVQGTEHLRTPIEVGVKIIEGLRGHTSGLAVPTFVVDLPQGGGKVPVQPNYVVEQTVEALLVRNYQGKVIRYRNPKASIRQELTKVTAVKPAEPVTVMNTDNQILSQREGVRDEDRVSV